MPATLTLENHPFHISSFMSYWAIKCLIYNVKSYHLNLWGARGRWLVATYAGS